MFSDHLLPEQVERFRGMWADPQVSIGEIGAAFGVQGATVYRVAAVLDLPPCPERRKVQGRKGQAKRNVIVATLNGLGRAPDAGSHIPAPALLSGQPARPRPIDRPGERWVQLR